MIVQKLKARERSPSRFHRFKKLDYLWAQGTPTYFCSAAEYATGPHGAAWPAWA
jgi:hypothetical protein